jgi:hypothetical protein
MAMIENKKAPARVANPYATLLRAIDEAPDISHLPLYERHVAEFRNILIEHPRLLRIHKAINRLRVEARKNRGKEQFVMPVIGPAQSGKSTAIGDYVKKVERSSKPPKGQLPVLLVNLSPRSSLKQLQADILAPLVKDENGHYDPDELTNGTEAEFRAKVRRYAELRKTEVICIDESQHLLRGNSRERAKHVADTIKLMSIEGATAFVVVGTEEAWSIFHSNDEQTPYRCVEPIILNPLDYEVVYDADLFDGYVASLDEKYVAHGLTSDFNGFVEDDMSACFWEVTRGIVGRASRLARMAWEYSFQLGETTVSRAHLGAAVDRWAIPLKLCRYNPFREGARTVQVVKKDWEDHPVGEDV